MGASWIERRLRRLRRSRLGKGELWLGLGFVLAIIGFSLVIYEVYSVGTIPWNTTTYAGIGMAGLGVAAGAAGLDKAA